MHQPFYKDLLSGQYKMPWTRLHALKDYYGMVRVLEEFPEVAQTFNVVPSMMAQVEEYAAGQADDPFLACALKPAESLTEAEQEFLLLNSFAGNPAGIIHRYPRYGELFEAWGMSDRNAQRARRFFGTAALRDLQVLSQLAWFDEEFQEKDAEVRDLIAKGRDYTLEDQALMGRKQAGILRAVLPVYREFAARGQIEISTTPFYHPILPLLCDSDIAGVSHPYVPLPSRFRYPADARDQLQRARDYIADRFQAAPAGLWPSEGSVSDEVLAMAAESGFRWAATDNGVLSRTLGHAAGAAETFQPYRWRQDGREIAVIFRDHALSDLIGFVYSRMSAADAAQDFLDRIRGNARAILDSGRDALVPIILDGENAWEFYERNGRPFLRELYGRISRDPEMKALRVSDALDRVEPAPLGHIFPGSWINANFDIWIGAEEDNKAWEHLLRARQAYDSSPAAAERKQTAWEELLIAEGSDWCWWYGPEHSSDYRAEFDRLYRDHLGNVYRALGLAPPEELSQPILRTPVSTVQTVPVAPIKAVIDGQDTSYFEWMGAGVYQVDTRSGSMHGRAALIHDFRYGSDGSDLFLRVDFEPGSGEVIPGSELRLRIEPAAGARFSSITVRLQAGRAELADCRFAAGGSAPAPEAECAWGRFFEARLSLPALGVNPGQGLRLQLSLWKDGLPVDALPHQGWLEISTAEPADWPL